jgi:hypothetical protein
LPADRAARAANDRRAEDEKVQRFREKARLILSGEQGMTAKGRAMLDYEARKLGLSQQDAEDAIRSLRGAEPPVVRESDQPPGAPPVQKPSVQSQQDLFRVYVYEALARSSRLVLSQRNEQKLIKQGAKLGLSKVLARQIVHRISTELDKRLASQEASSEQHGHKGGLPDHPELPAFLERAAAILAEQRGINARSRVLLAAAAGELGLNDAEMEQGIAALTGTPDDADRENTWREEREQAFRAHLRKTLALLPHKVATSRMEQTWVGEGQSAYALDEAVARQLVRAVAKEQEVRLVTEDQAAGHVEALVEQLLGDSAQLDDATRARVFAEGSQWGLPPMQVDAIIRDRVRTRRRAGAAAQGLTGLLVAAAFGCFLALLGVLGWLLIFRPERPEEVPEVVANWPSSNPEVQAPPSIDAPTGEEWWSEDEDLLVAVTQTRTVLPDMKGVLLGLSLTDSEARARAHREMVRVAASHTDQPGQRAILQELIAGCFAAEPSDRCAEALADELLAFVPSEGGDLPETQDAFRVAFWAIRTAVTALARANLPPERRDQLVRLVDRAISTTIDPSLAPLEMHRVCIRAFYRHLYRVITGAARRQPLIARPLFEEVTREAVRYLDLRTIELANVEFLTAALPAAGQSWNEFERLILLAIDSADPLVVLRIVDLFERLEDESLQGFLAENLLRRAGISRERLQVDEVARKVREALGAEEVVDGAERREILEQSATRLLADPEREDVSTNDELLQQVVDAAHAAAMACALAQGELGEATFDNLQRDGPIRLQSLRLASRPSARRTAPGRATTRYQQDNLRRYVGYLVRANARPAQRSVFLRNIAFQASTVRDVDPDIAEKLVSYLLRPKPDAEHQSVLEFVEAVSRWRNVRLALADQISETRLQKERVEEILSRALPRRVALGGGEDWKARAHEMLLNDVVEELSHSQPSAPAPDRIYDDLSAALQESYVIRCRLMGVSPDLYAAAQRPSELLRLMIDKTSESLSGSSASEPVRRHLESLPHQLDAVQYVGGNDLRRTVLLQRLWLRTLAADVARGGGKRASRANELVAELEQADAAAADLFAQMRAGEIASLKMWLLASRR